eukprot:TRINITY_DN5145_c2_g1_i1.p1 TRINITY_DN5145_c2_g1~~TRINITY_DN5145_c2_g1_i1.p1  ORF type:complete len:511 (+),score=107.38 TRINITY_DN5145_c2_g1_i1:83-1615(+)
MTDVPYHRQVPGAPTIVVKNGFLDVQFSQQEANRAARRCKSAPALAKEDGSDIQTEEDGEGSFRERAHSGDGASIGSATAPPSPPQGPQSSAPPSPPQGPQSFVPEYNLPGPSGVLMSAVGSSFTSAQSSPSRPAPSTGLQGSALLGDDWKLEDAAVDFHLSGLDEDEEAGTAKSSSQQQQQQQLDSQLASNTAQQLQQQQQQCFQQTAQLLPAMQAQQLSPQALQQLCASLLVQQMSTEQLWQLGMGGSKASSVQPSLASSPRMSPQMSPILAPQQSPLMSPLLRPQSPQLSESPAPSSLQCTPQQTPELAPQRPGSQQQQSSRQQSRVGSPLILPQPAPQQPGLVRLTPGLQCARPQAHTVRHSFDKESGMHQVWWAVDSSKLKGHERQTVSPSFELPFEGQSMFRLVLIPTPNPDGKGGASFKKAGGCGSVQLKSESSTGLVTFLVSISNGSPDFPRQSRGPVRHDFSELSTCGLPKGQDQWEFTKAVDKESQTFTVCLEISSHSNA